MSGAPSPASARPQPPPEPAAIDLEREQLCLDNAILKSQNDELRDYVEVLRGDRAILSGRIERFERWIEKLRGEAWEMIAPARVFREYAPGILHAVPVEIARPAPPASPVASRPQAPPGHPPSLLERLLADMAKLPSPADRILRAIAMSDPSTEQPLESVATEVALSPTGGHFKKGIKLLEQSKLIVVHRSPQGDRIRLAAGFWDRAAA